MSDTQPSSLEAGTRRLRLGRARGRRDRLAALQTAARELAKARDHDEVFEILGRHAYAVTQARVWAALYDAATDTIDVRFWLEDGERLPVREGMQAGPAGLGGVVARTGQTIATADYAAECAKFESRPTGPMSHEMSHGMPWVGVPLVSRGLVLGLLSTSQNRGEPFDATLVELLETLAAHSSMALDNLALRAEDDVRRAELEARAAETEESELRYRLLFEHNPHPMFVFDLDSLRFLAVNEATVRHYGYSREEFLAMQITDILLPEGVPGFATRVRQSSSLGGVRIHRKKDGAHITVEIASHTTMFAHRSARFSVVTDITDHQIAVASLRQQALHDGLTGLPNRVLLLDRLQSVLPLDDHRAEQPVALLVMDLDRFKEVNDTFGHKCGDVLLQLVSGRLQAALPDGATLARLGGDEFAVLLPNAPIRTATEVSEHLLRTLEEPFMVEGLALAVGASIGIALYPDHALDSDSLLRRADVAMYVAKRNNQGYAVYDRAQDQHSPDRLALAGELWQAIERGQLVLHYQPKLDLADGRVRGVEALVRWQHPLHGLVPPDQFIPLAEQTGLIDALSTWVLGAALRQSQIWRRHGLDLSMAVNLSMRTLHDPRLPATVAGLLERWSVPADALHLEITESSLMAEPARALEILERLRGIGVGITIDDFGTGYSSLAYLKRLQVNDLKIDRSFVMDMSTDDSARVIVHSTIDLAHNLGMRVIAEGVEDAETWAMLRELECDQMQGFYASRALPAAELRIWLDERLGRGRLSAAA